MGRQRGHAHRHDRALTGRQRSDRAKELVRATPIHDPQDGASALGQPERALATVFRLLLALDESAANESVDQSAGG